MTVIDFARLRAALKDFNQRKPFSHVVIDDFFPIDVAKALESEFLPYDHEKWFFYKNAIEDKKTLNDWNVFPSLTYRVFKELTSDAISKAMADALDVNLYPDQGLHGGGWHIHSTGGNLNPHLDYSIHPKVRLQRKLNLIIYLSSDMTEAHGGHLGFWSHDAGNRAPRDLEREVAPRFNRAVLFDTTQNSWHGLSRPLTQPENVYRKSLAVYYLTDVPEGCDPREKALFAPREAQANDPAVLELIETRSHSTRFKEAYRTPESV
ncbi:2OG-Fe(II) oxygenase [Roseateles chitosanitabidus]|uniref:2OG-Fe(II) oxygenase n=1 Tax=Roseateles chitosanitabidus TaxID=65048 RepID=UPI000834344E|nr:2OG-Fe(II) oxygenase [Roseateles chitosanitabidus]